VKRAVLVALLLTSGCDMLRKDAMYESELESCYQFSKTCEQYVACRKTVADKYGRAFDGTCDDLSQPPLDAGGE